MLGIEVEGVQKLGGEFEGIVVAQVITRDKHPERRQTFPLPRQRRQGRAPDRLRRAKFKAGDKVPLILPGARLPLKPGESTVHHQGRQDSRRRIHGMMCSPQELGLPDQVDGLLILREDATVGQPFAEYLGRTGSDVVYDLEITPNRPDLNSVIGIAREISAHGNPLQAAGVRLNSSTSESPSTIQRSGRRSDRRSGTLPALHRARRARRENRAEPRLAAHHSRKSRRPQHQQRRGRHELRDAGNRPALHAFDYHLLQSRAGVSTPTSIVVRRAAEGENSSRSTARNARSPTKCC